jgi:hypothetical protein
VYSRHKTASTNDGLPEISKMVLFSPIFHSSGHCKAKKNNMCVYGHMSKKSRVGRHTFFLLLSTKPEIVVTGSGIRFRYLIFENSGKMTNYAVFLPSLRLKYDNELFKFISFERQL